MTETTNKVHGVKIGPLSIGTVLSWLKVEFRQSAEPVISYRIELMGIPTGRTRAVRDTPASPWPARAW